MPALTVISPVLNAERTIGQCLRSVSEQGCADVEHLVCDGVSTDGTLAIVEEFARAHPHVRLISQKDNGQSQAMNRGLELARAPIVGFLNGDDFYEPGALSRALEIFADLPEPAFVVGACNVRNAQDEIVGVNRARRLALLDLLKGREFPYNPSCYFYHRSLHERVGGYDETEHYVMDLDFILRAVQRAHVCYVDEVWGNFRWIEGTKTFGDATSGRMDERTNALRRRYRRDLPPSQRLAIALRDWIQPILRPIRRRLGR